MNGITNWIKGARWRMSLSHCVEGLLIQIPATLVTHDLRCGVLAVVIWYWSRKKLEVEIASEQPGQTHVDTWTRGWFPWQWDAYQALDVVLPALSSCLIAALVGAFLVAR
jgi:hypothetical protein